jgi:Tfp pilus assembly protein PilF
MRPRRLACLGLLACLLACPVPPRLHPRSAEEVSRGYRYLADGDTERAEVAFRHALAFDPDFPEGENGLGLVARLRGDLPAARRAFERAISLRPDFAEAHANLGELLLAGGAGQEAEERLRAALAIDPDLADARQNLARALLWRGLAGGEDRAACLAAARREVLHLLEADPDRAAAHQDLAFLDYSEGRFERAERSYRRAAELAPASEEAQHGLCISLVRLGRCAEGAAACQACLALAPASPRCGRSLAGARACAGPAEPPASPPPSRSPPGPGTAPPTASPSRPSWPPR